jgi:hypothetical protein
VNRMARPRPSESSTDERECVVVSSCHAASAGRPAGVSWGRAEYQQRVRQRPVRFRLVAVRFAGMSPATPPSGPQYRMSHRILPIRASNMPLDAPAETVGGQRRRSAPERRDVSEHLAILAIRTGRHGRR